MQGPVEHLDTEPFWVPHFFDYGKQLSFSLHDLALVCSGQIQAVVN